MRNVRKLAVGMGVCALLVVGWVAPQTSAEAVAPKGYTIIDDGSGNCDLATLDLVTGTLTDLPAAPSSDACAVDLAAAPNGTVYGVDSSGLGAGSISGESLVQAAQPGRLITFAADGTPSTTPIVVEDGTNGGMVIGGIAVSPSGTIYVHLVVDQVGCDTGTPSTTSSTAPLAAPQYQGDSVCLYTLDAGTGIATLVGTTDLFETPFLGLASCSGLTTLSLGYQASAANWGTESASTGAVTLGASVTDVPLGYDCDSTTGGPLWSLQSPNGGVITALATEVTINTVDPATGAITEIVPVSDSAADLVALAVVPTAAPAPTTTIDVANANEVAPAFTG
jgi:hypothetical protein